MGFAQGWHGCTEGNPKEQLCQPEENPVLPDSFTQILQFRIGLPKILGRFCIGPSEIHRWVRISPPQADIQNVVIPLGSMFAGGGGFAYTHVNPVSTYILSVLRLP